MQDTPPQGQQQQQQRKEQEKQQQKQQITEQKQTNSKSTMTRVMQPNIQQKKSAKKGRNSQAKDNAETSKTNPIRSKERKLGKGSTKNIISSDIRKTPTVSNSKFKINAYIYIYSRYLIMFQMMMSR